MDAKVHLGLTLLLVLTLLSPALVSTEVATRPAIFLQNSWGSNGDAASGVAVDSFGNSYTASFTHSNALGSPFSLTTALPDPVSPFPSYYRSPRVQKYFFTTFNDPTSEFTAFQLGSIDVMDSPATQSQLTAVQGNSKYQANVSNDLGSVQVIFNAGRFPSNFTAFRQALSLMIDRTDILTTALHGLGGTMPDQLTPSWPSAYHVPGGFKWDINLPQANATLFAGGFRYNSSGNYWYNVANTTNHINPATAIFYSRADDPLRLYIGVQVATMQGATKGTYHFDRLFTVTPVTSYVAAQTVYNAPPNYRSNNCNGTGYPCFTAYTQSLSFPIADPGWMWQSFGTTYMDKPYFNFGHWQNATINGLAESMHSDPVLNNTKVQLVNEYVTQQAWWDPIYYQSVWIVSNERVTGFLTSQNSIIPNGAFAYSNQYSYWRAHLKGRLYGGSIRVGINNPINELNVFNPNSNWCYDAIVYNRIYDSLLNFNYDTGGFMAGLATGYSVNTFNAPVYNSMFQRPSGAQWMTASQAPFWVHNNTGTHVVNGEEISYTLLTNATWHDGSPVTPNDVMWNIITDAMDPHSLLTTPYAFLDDVNVTGNTVNLFFNSTGFDLLMASSLNAVAPPLPWIHHSASWTGTAGVISGISLSTKASLNLTAAGGLNMLDGSGSYKFDIATTGDPFAVSSPFDLIANDNWYYRDANKATYATGIAYLTTYPSGIAIGTPISVAIALVNGQNPKGDVFSGGNFVTDPSTVSDTTSSATVTAIVYENPNNTITLIYNSVTGHWEGSLPTTGLTGGTYHIQITATKSGSIPTTYGPVGSSQASAVGISWEGDSIHTILILPCCGPPTPLTPITILLAASAPFLLVLIKRKKRSNQRFSLHLSK